MLFLPIVKLIQFQNSYIYMHFGKKWPYKLQVSVQNFYLYATYKPLIIGSTLIATDSFGPFVLNVLLYTGNKLNFWI